VIEIESVDDPRVSEYRHVGHPGWLVERGLFVAEGRLVVRRLFEAGTFNVRSVLVSRAAFAALDDVLESCQCPVFVCQQDALSQLTGFNFHRGCLALGERPPAVSELDRFARASPLVALEGLGNPDNVGGVFRVAAAFDAGGILLDRTSADPLYRKAIRTSMGWSLTVPFGRIESWLVALDTLRQAGTDLVALTPDRSSTTLTEYARNRPTDRRFVLMLGAEGPGLSDGALALATASVRIPIAARVDSLNVVVAAGIALAALSGRTINA
jgi:tRNA G18 (ribose-2'-O)-methylase SpoU